MNDLRIAIRQVYSYIPIDKKYKYYVVYNYTRNKIEIINELDCTYLLKLNSIYKIDNLDELVNKNTDYNFLYQLALALRHYSKKEYMTSSPFDESITSIIKNKK